MKRGDINIRSNSNKTLTEQRRFDPEWLETMFIDYNVLNKSKQIVRKNNEVIFNIFLSDPLTSTQY